MSDVMALFLSTLNCNASLKLSYSYYSFCHSCFLIIIIIIIIILIIPGVIITQAYCFCLLSFCSFCKGRTLYSVVRDTKSTLDINKTRQIAQEIVKVIYF